MILFALGLLAFIVVVLVCIFHKEEDKEVVVHNREIRRKRLKMTKKEYRNYQKAIDRHNVLVTQIRTTEKRIQELMQEGGE